MLPVDVLKTLSWPGVIESTRRNLGPILHGATPTFDRSGRPGHAYAFDGIDDYLEVPDNPALSLQREYSLVLTFKTSARPSAASAVTGGNGTVLTMHLLEKAGSFRASLLQLVNRPPYQPYMLYGHGSGKYPLWNTLILPDSYNQVAVTYAARNLRVAVNAVIKENIANVDEPVASTAPLIVGNRASPQEYAYAHKFFKGTLDQVQIFDWALSDAELAGLYASGVP